MGYLHIRMQNFEIVILVLTLLVTLVSFADKLRLPGPVLLVLIGLGIGFIPAMPSVVLSPEVVFFLFLPPILYDAASHTSWLEFKTEIRPIATLAIALVFFTTAAVAVASHYLIPGFTWALGFVLGAIVSPPDAVAATSITKGLGLNRRVVTILEGESLVNDASALIAYKFAIAAISTGTFVFWQAGLNFLVDVSGGIFSGIVIGGIFIVIHKKVVDNSIISTSLTLLTPFISHLTAEHLHFSGVLAVVTTGLMMSWRASDVFSYQTRIRNKAVWDTLIFLINGFIFILIGLQLPSILTDLGAYSAPDLTKYALVVSVVTIAVRVLWVFTAAFLPWSRNDKTRNDDTWKNVLIVAWTGTRGVVSLATSLALPLTLMDGTLFPNRSLILFLAFVVIFTTLVVQGMSLPLLIRALRIRSKASLSVEEEQLRLLLANQTLNFIDHDFPYELNAQVNASIRKQYLDLVEILSTGVKHHSSIHPHPPTMSDYLHAQFEIHKFERSLLIRYHKDGTFNQSVLRRLEQELDHEEVRFNQHRKRSKSGL